MPAKLEASPGHPSNRWRCEPGRRKFTWRGLETLPLDSCLRPLGWSWQGGLYRRGLDGRTLEIVREPHPFLKMHRSRALDNQERDLLLKMWAERISDSVPSSWLADLQRDEARFREIFQPISILPPDQYRALVLQLAEGCPWNRCRFCDLYRDRPFRAKSRDVFADHLRCTLEYFGPALDWRRGIFLGDGNAGVLAQEQLVSALTLLRETFPTTLRDELGQPRHPLGFERVSAFLDTFTGRLRSTADWAELRQLGLAQLHLGIESGSTEILELLGKPGSPERILELVHSLKAAGIAVSLIFMLGVGGREGAAEHELQTLRLLRGLPLTSQDRIYLSELLIHPHGAYAEAARGLTEMSRPECREQADRLRAELTHPEGPMVSLYDVRQFVYH